MLFFDTKEMTSKTQDAIKEALRNLVNEMGHLEAVTITGSFKAHNEHLIGFRVVIHDTKGKDLFGKGAK